MKRKIIAAALCAAMVASSAVYAMAATDTAAPAKASAGQTTETETVASAQIFKDVPVNAWYAPAVKYVNEKGLFSGTAADTFSPDVNMSRGMFVTALGRAAGVKPAAADTGFSDVSADRYYAPYIKWASDNGIVTGTGNGMFSPDEDVSREQMCAILVRFLSEYKKFDLSAYKSGSAVFSDASEISSWAKDAVRTAQLMGLIEGRVNGEKLSFDPKGKTTRAAAAAVFQRLDTVITKIQNGKTTEPAAPAQPGNSSGGSTGGSAGGNTGGNTGGSTGDNTGGSTGGNTEPGKDDNKHTDEEIQEEKEIAGYLQNISSKYKTTAYVERVSKLVKDSMDLLVSTINKILADRQKGTFISSEYVKSSYKTEIEQFRNMYNSLTEDQNTEMQNLAIRLESEAHIYVIMDYFGVKQADI